MNLKFLNLHLHYNVRCPQTSHRAFKHAMVQEEITLTPIVIMKDDLVSFFFYIVQFIHGVKYVSY
jgi:hypothetical protein